MAFFIFQQACLRESHHCDNTEEDICHAYQAYARLCEYGNLNTSINNVPGSIVVLQFLKPNGYLLETD